MTTLIKYSSLIAASYADIPDPANGVLSRATSMLDAKCLVAENTLASLIVWIDVDIRAFQIPPISGIVSIFCWEAPQAFGPEDVRQCLVVIGEDHTGDVTRKLCHNLRDNYVYSGGVNMNRIKEGAKIVAGTDVKAGGVLYAFKLTTNQLYAFLRSQNPTAEQQVASALVSLFSWLQLDLPQGVVLADWDDWGDVINAAAPPVNPPANTEDHRRRLGLFCAALFLPAYTRAPNAKGQVHSRINAALAGARIIGFANAADIQDTEHIERIVGNAQGPLLELIGRVVAINEDGEYDPNVSSATLQPLDDLADDVGLPSYLRYALDQMRMIYQNAHTHTARFALAVRPYVMHQLGEAQGEFAQDFTSTEGWEDALLNKPYVGLRSIQPPELRVAVAPALCYMGILYYANGLESQEEKNEFNHYNVESTRNKVANQAMQGLCGQLVGRLPDQVSSLEAQLIGQMQVDQAVAYMGTRPREEKDTIYDTMVLQSIQCPWREQMALIYDHEKKMTFLSKWVPKIRKSIDHARTEAMNRVHSILDQASRQEALGALTQRAMQAEQLVDQLSDPFQEEAAAANYNPTNDVIAAKNEIVALITGIRQIH